MKIYSKSYKFLDTDKNIAMVQPMILDYKGDNIILCKKNLLLIQIIEVF